MQESSHEHKLGPWCHAPRVPVTFKAKEARQSLEPRKSIVGEGEGIVRENIKVLIGVNQRT